MNLSTFSSFDLSCHNGDLETEFNVFLSLMQVRYGHLKYVRSIKLSKVILQAY